MTLNEYCYDWRKMYGLKQTDIEGSSNIANISAYENSRSSNYIHFTKYLKKAIEMGVEEEFLRGLVTIEEVREDG